MSPDSSIERLPQHRVRCLVSFSEEQTKKAEGGALQRLGKGVRIAGFREGKVPADLIKQKVNPEDLLEETIRELLPETLSSLVKEHAIESVVPPKVEVESRTPLRIAVTFAERPKAKVKSGSKISVPRKDPKVDEKDVQRAIDYLLGQYRTTKEVERAAGKGDQVTMDFVGTDLAGKEVPGTRASGYQVIIGSNSLIPGFEDQLINVKKGDQKSFTLTFPENYHAEPLRKKPVAFAVTVTKIEEVQTPALTDAFAREHDLGESVQDMKQRIEKSMREQEEQMDKQRRERELFEAIRNATIVDLAPELIEHAAKGILEEGAKELKEQNLTMEEWMKKTKKTPEGVWKDVQDQAVKRLTLRFGVETLIEERKIEVTDDEVQKLIDTSMATMDPKQKQQSADRYSKGTENYEQLRWQRKVEKLTEQMLGS